MEVRVKHLISFLQKLDPETPIELDKDGWLDDDFPSKDEEELIANRGVFRIWDDILIINN